MFLAAWNFPTLMLVDVIVPALLSGCALLIKPSEYAPRTALRLLALLRRAGLPEGLVSVAVGGPAVGRAVVALPADSLIFIGSSPTGAKVAQAVASGAAGPRRCVLEMGGSDAFYVAPDVADIPAGALGEGNPGGVGGVAVALAGGKFDQVSAL